MNIVDNSLCNIDFNENVTDKQVREYIAALFECGTDYIEVDRSVIRYIENVHTGDKFILKINRMEDLEILTRKSFAYVIMPVSMILIAKKFTHLNSIIEIDAGKYSLEETIGFCKLLQKSMGISAIRITKSFKNGIDEMAAFIHEIECNNINIMLNICPLNDGLNGVSNALYAYNSCSFGMITLSFGSRFIYTPLESFLMYLNARQREYLNPREIQHTVAALYVAASHYNDVSEYSTAALQNINISIKNCDGLTFRVDEEIPEWHAKVPRRRVKKSDDKKAAYSAIKRKYFEENDVEDELCEVISDAVDDANVNVYNNTKKKFNSKL